MVNPYVLGGAAFPDDLHFMSQPYNGFEDGLGGSNGITFIDPDLQTPPSTPYDNIWGAPVHRSMKESHAAYFVGDLPRQVPGHGPLRPAITLPPASSSYARCASPLSSIEPSPPGSGLSPPPDTESYHDGYPRTPPDTNLLSPFQGFLPLEPTAHAVQFTSMGPDYVNPYEVNSTQQLEYSESENGIPDFDFTPVQPSYFDSHAGHDLELPQSAAALDFTGSQPGLEPMRSIVKEEMETPSQYPPLEDEASSEGEPLRKRRNDDDDEDYQPSKRLRTSGRTPARRGDKVAIAASASPARRTRTRGANATAAPRATTLSSSNKARLICPDCKKNNFSSQSDLEAHLNKEHRRPFNCVFDFAGCSSTFANKNEWKRHVSTQHLLLNYWVCTEGTCAKANTQDQTHTLSGPDTTTTTTTPSQPTGAIFNRKDLFTQHLKRMHAPKEAKDLPTTGTTSSSKTTSKTTFPATSSALTAWNARLKHLQATAIRPRCHLPQYMRCPVAGCAAPPFRGDGAWNDRMEHVAKHMDRAARGGGVTSSSNNGGCMGAGGNGGKEGRVVFGGEGDRSLVEWAASKEVAIIIPKGDGEGEGWVLKAPLKRGPGGNVVVTAPVGGGKVKVEEMVDEMEDVEEEEEEEGEEIVVSGSGVGEEEDAEGEEDD